MDKLPSHLHLDKLGTPYETRTFSQSIDKGAASVANALGFRERQMVKTLIFELDTHERVLVMVGGDQSAKSGLLKKAVHSRNVRMASPVAVIETTGYQVGSIPPFHGQATGFRSFIDESLMSESC